jgi:hypothetical protein
VRTTIEIKAEHRAKLLEVAAKRGDKGFSAVIREALDSFFDRQLEAERVRRKALRLRGTFPKAEADRLRKVTTAIREQWR